MLTAVVCSLNRLQDLKRCLNALNKQIESARGQLSVLVVDNGSQDGSRDFLNQWADGVSKRIHFEDEKGLSHARNAGLFRCETKWIAYLDDDAEVHESWFEAFESAINEHSMIQAGGGRVILEWPSQRPTFVDDHDLELYSTIDLGDAIKQMGYNEIPVGANMFFQSELLLGLNGFPTEFGRIGDSLISGDESYIVRKLQADGIRFYYLPKMAVNHIVPESRARLSWLKKRKIAEGITQVRMDLGMEKIRKGNVKRFAFELKRMLVSVLQRDRKKAWLYRGRCIEYIRKW